MNNNIVYTPNDLYNLFTTLCGLVISAWAVVEIFYKIRGIRGKPNAKQDEMLAKHEKHLAQHDKRFEEYDRFFKKDKERLDEIDSSNRVTQKALLALLSHAINGDDMDSLQRAKESLEDYLTNK